MSFLDLTSNLKRVSSTNGGEYAGPCPFCGGNDRFRVWPSEGTTGRFWCRSCGKAGDGIQFLRDRDGLTYLDACATLGVMPSFTWKPGHRSERATTTGTTWTPKETPPPADAWQEKAASFLGACQKNLAGPSGSDCREWLKGRGLKPETIEAGGLGWNPADRYESRDAWGFPPETDEKGKSKNIWFPHGLIIPCFDRGRVIRLRVRRPDPGFGPRFVVISGSASTPLTLGAGTAWVVVESELDAFLLWQEAGDICGVLALGNAQARPDQETDRTLRAAGLILVSLDSDTAGGKEAWGFWKRTYPNAKRWPVPNAKDQTEAAKAGLNLRAWVLAGLPGSFQEPQTPSGGQGVGKGTIEKIEYKSIPESWRSLDEGTIERLCIMTIDAGLRDGEALRAMANR